MRKGRSSRLVSNLAMQALPAGTIVDGKVANQQELVRGLKALLEHADFSADSVVLGLRSSWVMVKTHRLPAMNRRELDKALEFELPELAYFPVDDLKDVCYDYFVNYQTETEVEVVVAAFPASISRPISRLFELQVWFWK